MRRVGHHDVGGDPALASAPVPADVPLHAWELEAHALFSCLAKNGHFSTDESRRTIEGLAPTDYLHWGYYEKFSAAVANLLREKGLLAPGELERGIFGGLEQFGDAPPFAPGDVVEVRSDEVVRTSWRRPHLRTPGYIFGVRGTVVQRMGEFADPTFLAWGVKEGPRQQLYRVRFRLGDVWSEVEPDAADDALVIDLYGPWLQRADGAASAAAASEARGTKRERQDRDGEQAHEHEHEHGEGHGHSHGTRAQIERAAVAKEGPPRPGSVVHEALVRLAVEKGLVTAEQLRSVGEALEMAGKSLPGAALVVRAWQDDGFRARLLADGNAAAAELGIAAGNPNAPTKLVVVADDGTTHNLIVCTLCSCYPSAVLGPAPLWYKSVAYRARAVRAPRAMLRESFGLSVPERKQVVVHDSTADLRFLVLPERPAGTEGWNDAQLRERVTRDAMLGTAGC
jgi:hypothetical protein